MHTVHAIGCAMHPLSCYDFIIETIVLVTRVTFSLLCAVFKTVFFFWPLSYKSIEGDTILITGGGKGIGRLLAVELAKHKPARIIIWGRSEDTLQATCKAIRLQRVKCDYMLCDVSDYNMVNEKAEQVRKMYGDVTMLINNAGVVYGNTIVESVPQEMEHTVAVNTLGSFWTIKAFFPSMMSNNHGHIVIINSMLGLMGLGGAADYVASKHALSGFHDAMCMEIDREQKMGVNVTSIHPYMVNTDMFSGVNVRFPWLFPYLDKDYVARRSVDAILTNQDRLIMPRIMILLYFIKCIVPLDALLLLQRFTGVHTAMDTFHSRKVAKT